MNKRAFQEIISTKGKELYRDMAWRVDTRPYYVLVSEIMLQQTQVARVEVKFAEFITRFPDVEALATAPLGEVLTIWSGLGYNRRAKFLWQAAQMIVSEFNGISPKSQEQLVRLPGVGVNTAGAICAYSFNQPVVFVETNIRTVYIHHFFPNRDDVADKEIREKVSETIDIVHPREWYWALMDYGTWLKKQKLGQITKSKHYTKQSRLAGSMREMRGRIIKGLSQSPLPETALREAAEADERFEDALQSLLDEGLVEKTSGKFRLPR